MEKEVLSLPFHKLDQIPDTSVAVMNTHSNTNTNQNSTMSSVATSSPEVENHSTNSYDNSTPETEQTPGVVPIPKKSALIKTDKPRPYICSTCTRAFARLEHLKRHQRAHTNEKPYQCAACGRCFARRDLVLRHQQKLHSSLPTNDRSKSQKKPQKPNKPEEHKEGDIVADYLNGNINIIYNNKNNSVPLVNKPTGNVQSASHSPNNTNTHVNNAMNNNDAESLNSRSNSTLENGNLLQQRLHINDNYSSSHTPVSLQSLNSNSNTNNSNSNSLSGSAVPPGYIDNSQMYDTHAHDNNENNTNVKLEFLNGSFLGDSNTNAHSNNTNNNTNTNTANNTNTTTNNNNNNNNHSYDYRNDHHTFRDMRHASFSAATSSSYTGFHQTNGDQIPQQVNFASPQLKPDFLNDDDLQNIHAYSLGMDDGNVPDFNINFNLFSNEFSTNHLNSSNTSQKNTNASTQNTTNNGHTQGVSPGTGFANVNAVSPNSEPQTNVASSQGLSRKGSLFNKNKNSNSPNKVGSLFQNYQPINNNVDSQTGQHHSTTGQHHSTTGSNASTTGSKNNETSPNFGFSPNSNAFPNQPSKNRRVSATVSPPQQQMNIPGVPTQQLQQQDMGTLKEEDWLSEFINAPIEKQFPAVSNHIGFTDSPNTLNSSSPRSNDSPINPINDLSTFFRSRQIDLSKHVNAHGKDDTYSSAQFSNYPQNATIPGRCSEKVRTHIMNTYNLKPSQFPHLDDLNHYLVLYELEFNKYFPFIHIPSLNIDNNLDQIPLLLSMSAIGALYSFHARNSSTLFNFSKFLIHNFMENQLRRNNLNEVPLHITQSLLLHMFLGMFHNDVQVTKLTFRQLTSLVSLVKTTKLDLPLENFYLPPNITSNDYTMLGSNISDLNNSFEYFIYAQSRIRTLHCLHYLCVLFASLIGTPVALTFEDIKCGSPCPIEFIWESRSANEWLQRLQSHNLVLDSKLSLIRLSSGVNSYKDLWYEITNHSLGKEIGLRNLLSLLMSLNGYIHNQRLKLEESNKSEGEKIAEWRMEARPTIESMLKTWETCYVRNGGILVPKGQNLHVINQTPVLKLILPLLSFAKIRKCVFVSPVLQNVWSRNWVGMNMEITNLQSDPEALRDSIPYSLDIINLWIDIISIVNDAEKTSVRTPIFFLTCLFTATLIISEYLLATEEWAYKCLHEPNGDKATNLITADRVLWLRTEGIFKKLERNLLPKGSNSSSYSEFLRIQANGALDVDILDDAVAKLALSPTSSRPIAEVITAGRLSSRCLSLGVRILADAPVWPIALVFAEALKARATAIFDLKAKSKSVSPDAFK